MTYRALDPEFDRLPEDAEHEGDLHFMEIDGRRIPVIPRVRGRCVRCGEETEIDDPIFEYERLAKPKSFPGKRETLTLRARESKAVLSMDRYLKPKEV